MLKFFKFLSLILYSAILPLLLVIILPSTFPLLLIILICLELELELDLLFYIDNNFLLFRLNLNILFIKKSVSKIYN